ncbi:P-loop containing nucleoside triphosphate hydrolase protein [Tuber magnatum]|uniref:P-loop containing nucleoside triphosphate hydrolase protein n=1 Tax=Tuber magnatum TaxID=42249 RepID=A0A317SRA7_9PEZI|nr:P-loop containing nucleoside triphosphate hydrolase protein [Tuber magnatum]
MTDGVIQETTGGEGVKPKQSWWRRKRQLNPLRWGPVPPIPTQMSVSKEADAGFFSRITFAWIGPLMSVGYSRPLESADIPSVAPNRSSTVITDKLQASFDRRRSRGDQYPLLWSLNEVFFREFWLGGLYRVAADFLLVFAPFRLRYLIRFSVEAYTASERGAPGPPASRGIALAFGLALMQIFGSLFINQFLYHGMIIGGQARAGLIGLIFTKSLRISGRARAGEAGWPNGRVVNLMSTDSYRVDQAASWFHIMWTSTLQIILTLILLLINISYSALAGLAILTLGVPALSWVVKILAARRKAMNRITDKRVSLTQEILLGVRFVKFFGWEKSFLQRLESLRSKEIGAIQFLLGVRAGINAVGMSLPVFASMLAFITYSLTGNRLDPASIFSSLALFNALRIPLNMLPVVISQTIDAWVSIQRMQKYLLAEEIKDEIPFSLKDITLRVGHRELIAIVGSVGSGKSSLLAALAGDMRRTSGNIKRGPRVAYCPQYAWIQNASVRENIIFGREFKEDWYADVIDACALQQDLDMLPDGDQTEIGERGITISGGQKQRLNIGRAIYFDADIVLMDDPLSAVDAHVGKHLFDKAICGLLKDKCRILATHQLHVINKVDRVVWMEDGRIEAVGTFNELMETNVEFARMMGEIATESKEEKEPLADDRIEEEEEEEEEQPKDNNSDEKGNGLQAKALMQAEERAVKSVPWSVYKTYIRASGSYLVAPGVVAPMSFFDTTPTGRIVNRFSKDVKRHESVLRSVVFAKFGEALSGTACIRAYGLQDLFVAGIQEAIDGMDSAYFITFANQRWLSLRLDVIGNLLVFTSAILVVTSRFNVNPSIAGVVLSHILQIVMLLQWMIRQLAEVENAMNSTERICFYGNSLPSEAELHKGAIRPSWPEHGEITMHNVEMRYRDGLPLVLKGLSMHVKGGERIGIVGRTGAGKSSIMSGLFRLVELSAGSIEIDGVDISNIGLHDLRSKLAIIPQDPTLFRGTVRSNLDPFGKHADEELWGALRQANLVEDVPADSTAGSGRIILDGVVEEEGMNFSLGQRQLMALARALVRGSRIIVCDEATSSVDIETDRKIQEAMAKGFKGRTLLCIAHRLRTIIKYDRVCVMDAGNIAEMGTPLALFDTGGIFRSMCDRSKIRREDFFATGGDSENG